MHAKPTFAPVFSEILGGEHFFKIFGTPGERERKKQKGSEEQMDKQARTHTHTTRAHIWKDKTVKIDSYRQRPGTEEKHEDTDTEKDRDTRRTK